MSVVDKLRGGDLRSIGRSNEIVADIGEDPTLIEQVFSGLYDPDLVIKARSADVIEKVTRKRPELLLKHTKEIISVLKNDKQQEVCWYMAQMIPRLRYTSEEETDIIDVLNRYLAHKSKIVRVFALEALTDLAEKNQRILKEVIDTIRLHVKTGSPAVQARGRKLLKRLNAKGE